MKYKLRHQTEYTYVNPVHNYQGILCLQPIHLPHQKCTNFKLEIEPASVKTFPRKDYFGNTKHYFSLHEPHKTLKVVVSSDIEILEKTNQPISPITCEQTRQLLDTDIALKTALLSYQLPTQYIKWDEEVRQFAATCLHPNVALFDAVKDLNTKIFTEFKFKSGATSVNTPIKTVLKEKKGVCQDFSHLMIACLRSVGLAARYVSGYIETLPPKGKVKLQGSDASHAWVSVYIPEMGWCEFDPTNNLIPTNQHIITAYGRDYSDISPLKGIIFSSGEHKVKVEVDVIREE